MNASIQVQIRSFSEIDPKVRTMLRQHSGTCVRNDGKCYLQIDGAVYCCDESPESNTLLEILSRTGKETDRKTSETSFWRDVFSGKTQSDPADYSGMKDGEKRCVVVFRLEQTAVDTELREYIPLEKPDRMVSTEDGEIVLLLSLKDRISDEIAEFAGAVAETMENEAGFSCLAGIGNPADSVSALYRSYRQAREAIDTGIRHQLAGNVFRYSRVALERLSDLIPEEKIHPFVREILTEETLKNLTDEMLETIRVFFRNDMNLSTTARELFIHRNTLLYRMEKIRKLTGLDVRNFEDAAVFRILLSLSGK